MNDIQILDEREVKNENIISKQEEITDDMKKNKIISIFYSVVGGAVIAVSLLFLLALMITGIQNNILPLIALFITIIFGLILIWTAYKT